MLDPRYRIQDTGYRIQDAGYRMLETGNLKLETMRACSPILIATLNGCSDGAIQASFFIAIMHP
jgi:hypothetical protein